MLCGNESFPPIGSNPSSTNLWVHQNRMKGDSFVHSLTVVSTSAVLGRILKHRVDEVYGYQQTQSVFNSGNNPHTPNSRMRLVIHRSFDEYAEQYT